VDVFINRQVGGIPKRTHCGTIFADFSDYSNEADFIHGLLNKNQKKLVRSFNFTFHYVDDFHSLNSSRCGDFVDCLYHIVPRIKDTADTDRSASYLDKHF